MPTLHLGQELLDELKARSEAAHPAEACGLLLGRLEPREGKGPKLVAVKLHAARNLHEGSRDRFEVAPEDLVGAEAVARAAGLDIVGTWHSHPDASAEPSERDRLGAQEAWPTVIVAVEARGGRPRATSWRCWELRSGAFEEQKICVC